MKDVKAFNEVAFANTDKDGNRYLNLQMRQSMDNEKGGNAYLVTTFNQEGKPYHMVRIGMDEAKSGPNEGKSEFQRLAAAAGWDYATVQAVEQSFDERAAAEDGKGRLVPELENKAMTVKGFPTADDLKNKNSQTVYYRDYKRQITSDTIQRDGSYVDNPEKRSAHFGKIEDTVTPYPDFNPEVNETAIKDRKELREAAKIADLYGQQAQTQAAVPTNPSNNKDGVDVADIL